MPDDMVQILFRGSEEYRSWLQDIAKARNQKVQRFLEAAVAAYVANTPTDADTAKLTVVTKDKYPYSAANKAVHEKLEAILSSEDAGTIGTVTQVINSLKVARRPKAQRRAK